MEILSTVLFLLLVAVLVYIWLNARRGGGNAPGRKPPEPEPKSESGTYYEIANVCHTLQRIGATNQYSKQVFASANVARVFKITSTTVSGLPAGTEALLTFNYLPHGRPVPSGQIKSNTPLADGQSTAEFNGMTGIIPRSKYPNDLIKWEAIVSATSGGPAELPQTMVVCSDVKRDA